jgi:hypothetical protein
MVPARVYVARSRRSKRISSASEIRPETTRPAARKYQVSRGARDIRSVCHSGNCGRTRGIELVGGVRSGSVTPSRICPPDPRSLGLRPEHRSRVVAMPLRQKRDTVIAAAGHCRERR